MRLVAGTIALTLFTSWATSARADDPRDSQPPPAETSAAAPRSKFPYRVARVMPESRQALLYDRARSTHILVEVGQPVDGYRVDTIEDDEVTLIRDGSQVVLAAPLHGPRNRARASDPRAVAPDAGASAPRALDAPGFAPLDPYGEPVRSASASEPAGEGGVRATSAAGAAVDAGPLPADRNVRTVRAPDSLPPPSDGGLAAAAAALGLSPEPSAPVPASAPAASAPAASAPAASASAPIPSAPSLDPITIAPNPYDDAASAPAASAPAASAPAASAPAASAPSSAAAPAIAPIAPPPPIAAAPEAPTAPGPVAARSTSLSRAEIDASLADFAKLTGAISASFSPAGVVLDRVDRASIFQRAGLRSGDTIVSIDGVRLRSIDDAASLYARVTSASAITVLLQRGGKPLNLRVAIQ